IDRRVEAESALVGAERAVELHAEAAVDVHLAPVVLPRHAEDDLALGLADALDDLLVGELGMLDAHRLQRLQHLTHGLMELALARVAGDDLLEDRLDPFFEGHERSSSPT